MSCHQWTSEAYCDALGAIIDGFASVVDSADPTRAVPSCPGWTVADVAIHTGEIHRWATEMVRTTAPERLRREAMDAGVPADAREYGSWLRAGAAPMVDAFRAADPGAAMWAWGVDKHTRFWPRRMVHETSVHRADAELAAGVEPVIEPPVAVDGVCELLENLPAAAYFSPAVANLRGGGERLGFAATDAAVAWAVTLGADGFTWAHEQDPACDVTVAGRAADLLLLVYNRRSLEGEGDRDRFTVDGDQRLLDHWLANATL